MGRRFRGREEGERERRKEENGDEKRERGTGLDFVGG